MKRIFLLCSIMLLLSSCMTTRLERQENRRKAKCEKYRCYSGADSMMIIRETVTIKEDTTIYIHIAGMAVRDTLQVKQDPVTGLINSKKSMLEVPFATSYAWVENGKLKHDLVQKDTLIMQVIEGAKVLIKENEILKEKLTVKVPPERVTSWQWFQIWCGRLSIILLLAVALYYTIIKKGQIALKWLANIK